MKWGVILCGVWLAQFVSLSLGGAILAHTYEGGLAGLSALYIIWPQYHIWEDIFGNSDEVSVFLSFLFINPLLYFLMGGIIGVIVQRIKVHKTTE